MLGLHLLLWPVFSVSSWFFAAPLAIPCLSQTPTVSWFSLVCLSFLSSPPSFNPCEQFYPQPNKKGSVHSISSFLFLSSIPAPLPVIGLHFLTGHSLLRALHYPSLLSLPSSTCSVPIDALRPPSLPFLLPHWWIFSLGLSALFSFPGSDALFQSRSFS